MNRRTFIIALRLPPLAALHAADSPSPDLSLQPGHITFCEGDARAGKQVSSKVRLRGMIDRLPHTNP